MIIPDLTRELGHSDFHVIMKYDYFDNKNWVYNRCILLSGYTQNPKCCKGAAAIKTHPGTPGGFCIAMGLLPPQPPGLTELSSLRRSPPRAIPMTSPVAHETQPGAERRQIYLLFIIYYYYLTRFNRTQCKIGPLVRDT